MVSTKLMTAEELERLPADDNRYKLAQGELVPMTPVNLRHHRVTGNVYGPLEVYVAQRKLGVVGGEGGLVLFRGPDTLLAPDIAFVRADRWPKGEAETRTVIVLAPDAEPQALSDGDVLDGGEVVPGFRLPIADIFQ